MTPEQTRQEIRRRLRTVLAKAGWLGANDDTEFELTPLDTIIEKRGEDTLEQPYFEEFGTAFPYQLVLDSATIGKLIDLLMADASDENPAV